MDKIAVLFLIFKRKENAIEAFKSIRQYQPSRIYIAADGPRPGNREEESVCKETRDSVLKNIDWDCDVKTLFRERNLGLGIAVADAISWFFENEEYGIIIEEDVIVSQDFFLLCELLLPHYECEPQIMQISAQNHSGRCLLSDEYTFNKYALIWGWATWRRSWKLMDMSMSQWPLYRWWMPIKYYGLFQTVITNITWQKMYKYPEKYKSWATRWHFAVTTSDGICICPKVNLARNIGTSGGTHYQKGDIDPYKHLKIGKLQWPIKYCKEIHLDRDQMRYDRADYFRLRRIGLKKKLREIFGL